MRAIFCARQPIQDHLFTGSAVPAPLSAVLRAFTDPPGIYPPVIFPGRLRGVCAVPVPAPPVYGILANKKEAAPVWCLPLSLSLRRVIL